MALRTILIKGDETLRKKSREVTDFNGRLHGLLDDMWDTMNRANGVGLAAPQVGILRRTVIIDVSPPPEEGKEKKSGRGHNPEEGRYELINPVFLETEGEELVMEGCLSVPDLVGKIKRPTRVKVSAQDRNGKEYTVEGTELLAKALCHELDHLDGILFIDKAEEIEEVE
jgi:peptide deformylase